MAGRLKIPLSPRDEARMTLIEHLGELRSRIIKIAAIFVLAAVVMWFFVEPLFYLLLEPAGERLQDRARYATWGGEQSIGDMKLALWAPFVRSTRGLLYRVWPCVAPAV